ncbi:hypothetical protein [Azospira restricta]|uniref:Transmembrane protein n=1 Tax=Azospira restricta TaxID=404405 RepID=A0A974SPF7_9RHOO|nr:hypothetical protein [Azospira restricta]QRJ64032.1 hypothetical protein IWH25_01330 [Azospira restricta]
MKTTAAPPPAAPRLTSGQRALLLTLAIFLLPVAIGGGMYLLGWRPAKTSNHGELVQPLRPLPLAALGADAATAVAGKWLLLVAGDAPCEAACVALAEQTRAIQVSLNRDMGRLRRIVLVDATTPALVALQAKQPDLLLAAPPPAWRTALAAGARHRLFVVDPAGNLMMQYAPEAEAKGVRADLERLLKYSWIG